MISHSFLSLKIMSVKTGYETYNSKLFSIFEELKTWRQHPKSGKHKVFVFPNHNNLYYFIDTKNPSARWIRLAQELSSYYFRMDKCKAKANGVADEFFEYSQ